MNKNNTIEQEREEMERTGLLISKKQFHLLLFKLILSLTLPSLIFLAGLLCVMFIDTSNYVVVGVIMLILGGLLLIISVFYSIFAYSEKLTTYLAFKKVRQKNKNKF